MTAAFAGGHPRVLRRLYGADVADLRPSSSGSRGTAPAELVAALEPDVRARLGGLEAEAFLARLEKFFPDLAEPLTTLYGGRTDPAELVRRLVAIALDAAVVRPWPLRVVDRRREVDPQWFQGTTTVGYACYPDRFADDLAGLRKRLDYLCELGVTYLHLMPVLATRDGANDGGYAVADYDAVEPRLGSMADLEDLAADLRGRGIALCLDLVLNHTAEEHEWARRAAAGDPHYRAFYTVHPDRSEPDAYERTLPDVFPDVAPGSFTHVPEMDGWVWTTFNRYQWDLDFANPDVFAAVLATALRLANHGVDVLRLDAVPFLWHRVGTDCRNLPEVHLILQALRALVRLAAPGVLLKAEAIVGPDDVVQYLGAHDQQRRECDLAYHNQLMVMLWSSVATRDSTLARVALSRLRREPPDTSWVTFLRNHDDIGWAVSDVDTAVVGWDGPSHRHFLNEFFAGRFDGSFARGELFGVDPRSGDARICGSTAALCGVEAARPGGDPAALELAVRRLETLYAVVFSFGGIPLLWMGDELALGDDAEWRQEPGHAEDGRWRHRPRMDWAAAGRRHDESTVEGRVFGMIRRLVKARHAQPALQGGGETTLLHPEDAHVLAYRRCHPTSAPLLVLANFADESHAVTTDLLHSAGIATAHPLCSTEGGLQVTEDGLRLPAWGFAWIGAS